MEPSSWASALGVQPWWERSTVPCRDASASDSCVEHTWLVTECETVVDPATGEPVKHCVKLYKRYLKCAGRPETVDEQKQEMMARGEGAQQLEPNLVELPSRRAAAAAGGDDGSTSAGGAAKMEDVGHAFEEFLRFAEELQEQMVPGAMHLDQAPPAPALPYSDWDPQQPQAQQQEHGAGGEAPLAFSWLGGLLFGKRRAGGQQGGGGAGSEARRRQVDASMWKEFERDFTEV